MTRAVVPAPWKGSIATVVTPSSTSQSARRRKSPVKLLKRCADLLGTRLLSLVVLLGVFLVHFRSSRSRPALYFRGEPCLTRYWQVGGIGRWEWARS